MMVLRLMLVIGILIVLLPLLPLDMLATSSDDVPLYRVWVGVLRGCRSLMFHGRGQQLTLS